jgi:hypothetical protein
MHLKDDPTRWWEKEHDPRCNIEVTGAEPLVIGGDCTCGAVLDQEAVTMIQPNLDSDGQMQVSASKVEL